MRSERFLARLGNIPTPFYLYDTDLLVATLDRVMSEAERYGYKVHYAMKANFNERILRLMHSRGIGADCVSGGEVAKAIEVGMKPGDIVFAGVAKSDAEITYALEQGIFSFNCESREELEVINHIAGGMGKRASIALRINPDVDPKTHKYISTGKADNKFGISYEEVDEVIELLSSLKNLDIVGLHFHIGSQIRDLSVFEKLCHRVNSLQEWFEHKGLRLSHINVGGGLGVNYEDPESEPIPDFGAYFKIFNTHLSLREGQTLHFELGRSIVAQCGELITRVLYNKVTAGGKNIVLVDAGMTELIRPALYQASHHIKNLSSAEGNEIYTVAGPICESSDVFAHSIELPVTKRGNLLSLMSAGAYGRVMASNYNLRKFPDEIFTSDL